MGFFIQTCKAGKTSHRPKHGQVWKTSPYLGLCPLRHGTVLPPTNSLSQGLSEDNADLETQPPLLPPAVWAESSCALCASSTPFPFALYPFVLYPSAPCMLDCHLSAAARLCPSGKWVCQALQVGFIGHSQGHAWWALTLPTRNKKMEKTSQHWQPVTCQNNPSDTIYFAPSDTRWVCDWSPSSLISLQKSRVSELAGGHLTSTSPVPRPRWMVEDSNPAHLCFQPASSEVQIYTCSWLTRSPWRAAIKRDTVRRYSADWLHAERAKIDGGSTRENMVWGKTKNREAHVSFISTLQRVRWSWQISLHFTQGFVSKLS